MHNDSHDREVDWAMLRLWRVFPFLINKVQWLYFQVMTRIGYYQDNINVLDRKYDSVDLAIDSLISFYLNYLKRVAKCEPSSYSKEYIFSVERDTLVWRVTSHRFVHGFEVIESHSDALPHSGRTHIIVTFNHPYPSDVSGKHHLAAVGWMYDHRTGRLSY